MKARGANRMNFEEQAWSERMGAPVRIIQTIGARQLSMCRSDEARRILVRYAVPMIHTKETLRITLPAGEMAEIYKALDWVAEQTGLAPNDRAGQLLAWAIDANAERQ